ncbi:MAG: STAS domain-containing protein [Planctomyces sp.]|nr:STAS domain-containing protein [Planctomyces sp.]
MSTATDNDFRIEWHGDVLVLVPATNIESLNWDVIEQTTQLVLQPIREQTVPLLVVDLTQVGYFGSVFLALLLRCHKLIKSRGGELVICGAKGPVRELLRITALDTLWAIYDTRGEALDAISG